MAAITFSKQPKRWGNESTNFFHHSRTSHPGDPVPQKVYRCADSQYSNCGHLHNGTKMFNNNQPQDAYGLPSAYKLRAEDQRLPKPLQSMDVHRQQMKKRPTPDLYQSHFQRYHSYAMPKESDEKGLEVLQAMNKEFYSTTYQKAISRPASGNSVLANPGSLTSRVLSRRHSISGEVVPHKPQAPPSLRATRFKQRPLSARLRDYPSKGEVIRSVSSTFPSPAVPVLSQWMQRPSSAVSANRIQGLRT